MVPDSTPQVLYDISAPEVHENGNPVEDSAPSSHGSKSRLKWPWVAMVLVIAAAIAIGVGVGNWRRRDHRDLNQSATIMYGTL